MSRRAEKSTQAMQRGTAAHYETHPFEFMTEGDAARIEAALAVALADAGIHVEGGH